MTKLKLWEWVFKKAREQYREAHMDKYKNDIKCPHCNEWFSVSGIDYKHEHVDEPDFGFHVKCGKCQGESYWNAVAFPFLALCNEKGNPL